MSFGKLLGIGGYLLLMLGVWAIVHWQAEPGTEITFGFITYTKPASQASTTHRLAARLTTVLANVARMSLTYSEPCGKLTVTDQTGKEVTIQATAATLLGDAESREESGTDGSFWFLITNSGKKHVLSAFNHPVYRYGDGAGDSALSLFQELKVACLSAD